MKQISIVDMQAIQLEALDKVAEYCASHGLTYFLTHGTLIGAVRHKGFIPWDDDIDLAMPRKDYEKFISGFLSDNQRIYSLHTVEKCRYAYTKVYDTRTMVFEGSFQKNSDYGVNIDVFPYDFLPDDQTQRKKVIRKARFWQLVLKVKLSRISNIMTLKQNIIIFFGRIILFPIQATNLARRIEQVSLPHHNKHTEKMGCLVWGYGEHEVVDASALSQTINMEFEGRSVKVPIGYDVLLRSMYGEYLEFPPKEKQISHHDFVAFWKE